MCHFIVYFILFQSIFFHSGNSVFNCHLPEKCRLETVFGGTLQEINEKEGIKVLAIMCDINNDAYEFKFNEPTPLLMTQEKCDLGDKEQIFHDNFIIFRSASNELVIFNKRLNFTNAIRYFSYFKSLVIVKFWAIKGFDIDISEDDEKYSISFFERPFIDSIEIANCRLEFYHNKIKLNSYQDFVKSNVTKIASIFQIRMYFRILKLANIDYREAMCPLVLVNAMINQLALIDLVDTFYKKSTLTFKNEIYTKLNCYIKSLVLYKVHNINLDLNMLHPSVFNYTSSIVISSGSLNSINGFIFKNLKNLLTFVIDINIFRKINHKQGIKWIRQMNYDVNVNLSKLPQIITTLPKEIVLSQSLTKQRRSMSVFFPEEDFCIYADFPFNQLVVAYELYIYENIDLKYKDNEFTCTYSWLVQYFEYYFNYYLNILSKLDPNQLTLPNLYSVLNSTAFKSISKCNFEQRISSCNRSNYQVKEIWDKNDFFILNKKMQIAFKLSLYPVSFLGLVTNFIVVFVLLIKCNSDLFKEYKQYSYLCLNSIFCMMISVIEILSWMTECFYPFEAFCPEIRKQVGIQFFKIILKECLITVFRFMCNFTYVAFALNRISLIGKDHGKIVTFMSELGIKKYIGVTICISCALSWIKYFKYQVNYFYPHLNFPISNEMDIIHTYSTSFDDFYFTFNSICDVMNYMVFVVISGIIDVCMVVQLRRTLNERAKKSESMNQKQNETKKAENEEAVNKAIKMVVLNSAIGIFLKLPVSFIPLLNMCAEFYYKDKRYRYTNPYFGDFYSMLFESGFYNLIQDMSALFFTLSFSIQMFIYNRFDKKFRTGYERLVDKAFTSIKKKLFKPE